MFNGIIFNTGKVKYIKKNKGSIYVGIQSKIKFKNKDLGASVSCDGVCLTITKIYKDIIFFYISKETFSRSNFRFLNLSESTSINLILGWLLTISIACIFFH